MRFPFRFMSLLAIAFGLWVGIYLFGHRQTDTLSMVMALVAAFGSIAFGTFGLLRSPVGRRTG